MLAAPATAPRTDIQSISPGALPDRVALELTDRGQPVQPHGHQGVPRAQLVEAGRQLGPVHDPAADRLDEGATAP